MYTKQERLYSAVRFLDNALQHHERNHPGDRGRFHLNGHYIGLSTYDILSKARNEASDAAEAFDRSTTGSHYANVLFDVPLPDEIASV